MKPIMSALDKQKQIPHPPRHFSKEEMDAKKVEFEKRLNLTEEQKIQVEINKQNDKEKIKPIIDKLHQKKIDYKMLETNTNIDEQTKTKIATNTVILEKSYIEIPIASFKTKQKIEEIIL